MTAPVELYVRDGSRFVPLSSVQDTAPLPYLTPNPPEPTADNPVVQVGPGAWRLYAPKCPHGHFRNCRTKNCTTPLELERTAR